MLSYTLFLWSVLHLCYQVSVGQEKFDEFPDEERIRDLVANFEDRVIYHSNDFKVYPQLLFSCNGILRRLTFIGLNPTEVELTLQLFSLDNSEKATCRKYTGVSLKYIVESGGSKLGVVNLEVSNVTVRAGTILGLQHSGGALLYRKGYSGIQSLSARAPCVSEDYDIEVDNGSIPLIATNIGCDNSATAFVSQEELRQVAREEKTVSYSVNKISVVPALNFSARGKISSWTIALRPLLGMQDSSGPYIQIWRPTERDIQQSTLDSDVQYSLVQSTEIYIEEDSDDLIVTYVLDEEMNVEAGDIVGVKQPQNSKFFLMFNSEGPANIVANPDAEVVSNGFTSVMRLPLVTPEFYSSQTLPSSPQPKESVRSSGSTGDGGLPVSVIIAGILGPVVIGLMLTVGVVVACLVWRRKRARKSQSPSTQQHVETIGSNPVYAAPVRDSVAEPFYIAPTRNSSALYESIHVAQTYEVPITSTSMESDLDSHHIYHVLEASKSPRRVGVETLQLSEQSEGSHEYHELEYNNSSNMTQVDDSKLGTDDLDYELYVPCMEQRHSVVHASSLQQSFYESLQKVQSSSSLARTSYDFFEESPSFWEPGSTADSLYQQLSCRKFREIRRNHVTAMEHLGSGRFGTVKKGVWKTPGGEREVAVKMLQSGPTSQDTIMFLQEAATMGQFRHPNVVQLLGVVTLGEPLMIVLELLSGGDLSTFLNKNRALVMNEPDKQKWPSMLLGFCQQVAAGLDYLLAKGFVHRDIAARNILLSSELMCKISDFGMSRDLQAENYYVTRGGEIPVKWTAPETLNYKKYSAASDIWSFGCFMYEIWSIGHKPFEGHTNMETIDLVERGYRLAPPPGCPHRIYHLMTQCWNPTARLRPSSSELLQQLTGPEEKGLLQLKEEESGSHHQAHILGAPLEAGKHLYRKLQDKYFSH